MRSADRVRKCLLFGVDRTYLGHHETDALDPLRTWTRSSSHRDRAQKMQRYLPTAGVLDRSVQMVQIMPHGKAERVRSRCGRGAGNVRLLVERLRRNFDRRPAAGNADRQAKHV